MRRRALVWLFALSLILMNLAHPAHASEPTTYALDFSGSSDSLVSIPDDESLKPSDELSVMCWAKWETVEWEMEIENGIINKFNNFDSNGSNMGGYLLFFDAWGENEVYVTWEMHKTNTSVTIVTSNTQLTANNWHHLCGTTKNGGTSYVYVNGSKQAQTDSQTGMKHTDYRLQFANWTCDLDGAIDDVMIWNRQLSTTEIQAIYNSGIGIYEPSNTTGLEACWKFDEGTGSTLYDRSGNNNHGTISNATWTTGITPDWDTDNSFYYQPDYLSTVSSTAYSSLESKYTMSLNGTGTATTKVHCGSLGQPLNVLGASTTYNSSTDILSLTVSFSSLQEITIEWAKSASGYFILTVHVKNAQEELRDFAVSVSPLFGSDLEAQNMTTDNSGVAQFELSYGTYLVKAYDSYDEKTVKSMRVWMTCNRDIGFDFGAPPRYSPRLEGFIIIPFVVIVAYLMLRKVKK